MFDPYRLERLLRLFRFDFVLLDSVANTAVYIRAGRHPELFEVVFAEASGRRGEAAYGSVGVSVLRNWPARKGLGDTALIREIAADKTRGWTVLNRPADAAAWEENLARISHEKVCGFATDRGTELLNRTGPAREAVAKYLEQIAAAETAEKTEAMVRAQATGQQLAEAERILSRPGVRHAGLEKAEVLAALILVMFASEIEPEIPLLLPSDPLRSESFLWRYLLLADRLATRFSLVSHPIVA